MTDQDIKGQVDERHSKVSAIITRHLKEIRKEILAVDPDTMNIDGAGDEAEIAHQVLTALVEQLRGFGCGARRSKIDRDFELFGK